MWRSTRINLKGTGCWNFCCRITSLISRSGTRSPVRPRVRTFTSARRARRSDLADNSHSTSMSETNLRVLISADRIQTRILELGEKISKDYPTGNLHMICILKGAVFFMTDLTRALKRDVLIDFMGISTYGRGKTSSGEVRVTKDLDISLEGADVLIVEDIVDSGITLNYLMHVLDQRKPRSIRIAALLDKPERRLRPVHVSYVGFEIPDEFVVGYGLDYAEKYRNLRDICVLEEFGTPAAV